MAVAYKVKVASISTDGINIYLELEIFDGVHNMPNLYPVFPADTAASAIDTYIQAIADAAPSLGASFTPLVGKTYTQA